MNKERQEVIKMNKNFKTQTINIDSIYAQLKAHLAKRTNSQGKQENLWKEISRTRSDRDSQMKRINNNIGKETHEINKLISALCRYNKTHRAMNLASTLLDGEISRTKTIISKWQRNVSLVSRGKSHFITSYGTTTTDTSQAQAYVVQKQQRLAKLMEWKRHVDRYRV